MLTSQNLTRHSLVINMKNKPKLSVISTPEELTESKTFWSTCPRQLEYLPEQECSEGKPQTAKKSSRVATEGACAWWINSAEHNYCFWKYIHDKSTPEGAMPELVQTDLAKLFGWSNTKTHFAIKEALKELVDALNTYDAQDLIPIFETDK